MEVEWDGHCFGCGPLNTDGLRLKFEPEAVGWAAWHAGHPGVTGRLQVSFRRPLKLGERVRVVGQVEKIRRTLVYTNAYVQSLDDGGRIADATATLMTTDTKVDLPTT